MEENVVKDNFIVLNIHNLGNTSGVENYEVAGTSNSFFGEEIQIEKVDLESANITFEPVEYYTI